MQGELALGSDGGAVRGLDSEHSQVVFHLWSAPAGCSSARSWRGDAPGAVVHQLGAYRSAPVGVQYVRRPKPSPRELPTFFRAEDGVRNLRDGPVSSDERSEVRVGRTKQGYVLVGAVTMEFVDNRVLHHRRPQIDGDNPEFSVALVEDVRECDQTVGYVRGSHVLPNLSD